MQLTVVVQLTVTYVTTDDDRQTLVVHLFNGDTQSHTMSALLLDGTPVSPFQPLTLDPNRSYLVRIPLAAPKPLGAVWTLALQFPDAQAQIGYGGRVLNEFFPIEVWQSSSDCPFPGVNDTNYQVCTLSMCARCRTIFLGR